MEFFEYSNLCNEMRDWKIKDVLTQKRRQQLRANNHELRQLERHLQSAVVNKQLKEQLWNATQLKEAELRKKEEENTKFAADCELGFKSLLMEEEQERQKKKILLEIINCQINKAHQKRRTELEDTYNDRAEMEKLMKRIETENVAKRKEAERVLEQCKKEMEETCNFKRLKQRLEYDRNIDENQRNLSYQEKCDRIKSEKEVERTRILEEKEDLNKILAQQLTSINLEKEKRDYLFLSLSMQERIAKEEEDFKEALVKRHNEKLKVSLENENYCKEVKIRKEIQFKEEEDKFRIQNLRYLEDRDKLWQLSDEKRRRKIMDHNKELREIIEQRRYRKANKIAEQLLEFDNIKTDNDKTDLLIERERVLMLNSVPKDLLHYLPPGALKSSDKEIMKF